jgi:hypothetical protein
MRGRSRRAGPILGLAASLLASIPLAAQGPAPGSSDVGGVDVSGVLRTRVESWQWFGDDPNGEYTYSGSILRLAFAQTKRKASWHLEIAVPVVLGLPDGGAGSGAQGPLGMGTSYFAANNARANAAAVFLKQAFVRVNAFGGIDGQSLRIGRMEFVDGAEVVPSHATLAALKRDRIAHRLIGNFGFSHVGRSVDGAHYGLIRPNSALTLVAARPTRGVFQVDGWGEVAVTLLYGAVTGHAERGRRAREWRVFGLGYVDSRRGVVTADNRSLADRQADRERIAIATAGGHYLQAAETPAGLVDLLFWGAVQGGAWGELAHRAAAAAVEAGWQPQTWASHGVWVRGGLNYGSGDGDPADATHGTFFQVLPTPRVYARFPFFNMMNSTDAFGELVLKPRPTLTLRTDVHALRLAKASDLWYQGGGAFQPSTFGYSAKSSNGHSALAVLADLSAELVVNARLGMVAYYGHASAGTVIAAAHTGDHGAQFGYVEALLRF